MLDFFCSCSIGLLNANALTDNWLALVSVVDDFPSVF